MTEPNRLSSTIGGNREIDQLYMTSQVSNITFQLYIKYNILFLSVKIENKEYKIAFISL